VPTALVTGASAGLGAEFARQLASDGEDLVLVARDKVRLDAVAAELSQRYGRQVDVISADLATDAGCAAVAARLADLEHPIEVLVNNAGIGTYRRFGKAELVDEERQLDLNVRAVLRLSHAAVQAMTARGRGRIINVSSVSAFVPRGGNATYAASKAWVTLFSEALSVQLAGSGVTVTAICPGFTRTEFHERAQADMSHVPQRMWLDVQSVVAEGLADAAKGKPVSVPSRQYKALLGAARSIPRPLLRRIMSRREF
jgi:short-subunit dehydrogenase